MKITCKSLHVGTNSKERLEFCVSTKVNPSLDSPLPLIQIFAKEEKSREAQAGKDLTCSDSFHPHEEFEFQLSPIVDGKVFFGLLFAVTHPCHLLD